LEKTHKINISDIEYDVVRKIDSREHQDLVNTFERYKRFYDKYGNIAISEQEDENLRQNVTELQGIFDYYQILLFELKNCIQNYRSVNAAIKMKMYKPVRKMNTIDKKSNK
jgi:hypothetical protein